jgi:diguanylate cyclase (GGDEF)-like protein
MGGILSRIPTTSVFLFVMYFFISIATLFSRYGISNMGLKEIFEKSDDYIIAIDITCKALEINSKLYNVLFKSPGKNKNVLMNFMDLKNLENKLSEIFPESGVIKALFDNLQGYSSIMIRKEITGTIDGTARTYDVVIFPVLDNIHKLLGKIAISRDISDYKKLQESLREESIKDFLTGAYNRKYFYESLIMHINRFERYDEQFTLVMLDIDKFKRLNDQHGHLKGDWVLQETAKILKENIRDHLDMVSRFGGDEFLLILASTTGAEAEVITQRIKLQYSRIDNAGTSLSIGICQFARGMGSEEIIRLADSAMYKSKASGGNSVTVI